MSLLKAAEVPVQVRRRLALVAVVAVTAVAGGLAGSALAEDGKPTAAQPPDIPPAESIYLPGMSLDELAVAASGLPGEVAPPCPTEDVVTDLKAAGIEFGPCDPYPEVGEPIIVAPPERSAAEDSAPDYVCPASTLGKGTNAKVFVPCAEGARLVDVVLTMEGDTVCARVEYRLNDSEAEATDVVCEGDVNEDGVTVDSQPPADSPIAETPGGDR